MAGSVALQPMVPEWRQARCMNARQVIAPLVVAHVHGVDLP